jgi:putative tricarboxylic transport membrane protein
MRRSYQITGLAFLLLAAFLGYHAWRLSYYTPLGPGPGFFPLWICILLAVLAAFVFVNATFRQPTALPEGFFAPASGYGRIGAVVIALFAVANVMPVLGFRLTMLGFYLALLSLLGRRHPLETLILALIGSFGAFHVFVELLSLPLPVGVFGI